MEILQNIIQALEKGVYLLVEAGDLESKILDGTSRMKVNYQSLGSLLEDRKGIGQVEEVVSHLIYLSSGSRWTYMTVSQLMALEDK